MHVYVEVCAFVRSFVFIHRLTGCFGFNGPFRQYVSLYSGRLPEREKEKRRIDEGKMCKQPPPALTASAIGSFRTIIQINCKFSLHLRTIRPSPCMHPRMFSFSVCT